jgi:hypothetical protein
LLWLLRRESWFVIWGLLAILITMSGNLPLLGAALVFMPFVMLVAADIVSFSMNDLLEYSSSDDAPAALRLFGRNLLASVITAGVAGLIGLLLFSALGSVGVDASGGSGASVDAGANAGGVGSGTGVGANADGVGSGTGVGAVDGIFNPSVQTLLVEGFIPAIIACFAVIAASILTTILARRRLDRDKLLSSNFLALSMMIFGIVVQLSLQAVLVLNNLLPNLTAAL